MDGKWKEIDSSLCGAYGVYRLKDHLGKIIYIGQSTNLMQRIACHTDKPWSKADVILVNSSDELTYLERLMIVKFKPELNREKFWLPNLGLFVGKNRRPIVRKEKRIS